MAEKKKSKFSLKKRFFGWFFAVIMSLFFVFSLPLATTYAVSGEDTPVSDNVSVENNESTSQIPATGGDSGDQFRSESALTLSYRKLEKDCETSLDSVSWLICSATGKIAEATDWLYDRIQGVLDINPISMDQNSPVFNIWKYCQGITNIIFIVFLLVVIYSQLTGYGISNYGIKKSLPKLIVAAVTINLSFIICSLAVDFSNIVGNGLRGAFMKVQEQAIVKNVVNEEEIVTPTVVEEDYTEEEKVNNSRDIWGGIFSNRDEANKPDYTEEEKLENAATAASPIGVNSGALVGGTALAVIIGAIAYESGAIWMLIPVALGAIVSVATGLITIALRQAVVTLLIMISPLAIVACILPNTEGLFRKWLDLLKRMLIFYPTFSLLFGASSLAGFAIVASAKDGFGVLLGTAVQIFPLFFSWSLMKMSGTFLADINARMRSWTEAPLAANRAWAESRRQNRIENSIASGVTPSARLMQFMRNRRELLKKDTENAQSISAGKSSLYIQRKIAGSEIGDSGQGSSRRASRYTRNAKKARNYSLMVQNAESHTGHVLTNYGNYYSRSGIDKALAEQSANAWMDYGRAAYQKEIDDENDIAFLVDKYLDANKRDANNNPVNKAAFDRYVRSVAGQDGEQRLLAKIIAQASRVESKQKAEYHVMLSKWGHNGYNKQEFRHWLTGYNNDDDGWATDIYGKRLKNDDGTFVELVQGDALTKAPEKLVLYNKRDSKGLYFDFKDQDGNTITRIHRGIGDDGRSHDDAAFIKEVLSEWDIPISDPINNIYGILSGIKVGDINTSQRNEIGLSRYSTTIGRAMQAYKGDASWAGSMFNTGIGNRQIHNAAQYAIWVLDSIKKTLKPGAFNTQNPASVQYLRTIFNPDNWEKIFTEEEIIEAANINNELFGGEDWILDDDDKIIGYTPVDNPTYEQRMRTLQRKLIFPALQKVLPAFDRLRTSNTADNQKPGTADEQYKFLKMVEEKYENNNAIKFDPTLLDQDLQTAARDFRQRKHDRDGNLIFANNLGEGGSSSLFNLLEDNYLTMSEWTDEELIRSTLAILRSRPEFSNALRRFNEFLADNPGATVEEIHTWFADIV